MIKGPLFLNAIPLLLILNGCKVGDGAFIGASPQTETQTPSNPDDPSSEPPPTTEPDTASNEAPPANSDTDDSGSDSNDEDSDPEDELGDSECPTNYVKIPANTETNVSSDFCVMIYEAKNVSNVPTSQADGEPWGGITQLEAKTLCDGLNAQFNFQNKYALITNAEWMTIARNIESVPANWSSGVVGSGCIFQGNTGNNNACEYNKGDVDSGPGRNLKARHLLTTNEEIWDLSANAFEWVDWAVEGNTKAYVFADGAPTSNYREFNVLDTNISANDEMRPNTWAALGHPAYTIANGIGRYQAGSSSKSGAALRGGGFPVGSNAGIYQLDLRFAPNELPGYDHLGFRCVFHLK